MDKQGTQQQDLFHERIEDAIAAVIDACGGRKVVAAQLWPDKAMRDAHNLIDACLNPERRERLTPSQVVFVAKRGREAGCHALMTYLARECGYADPVPVDPQHERAALQLAFVESVRQQQRILARMERLAAPAGTITPIRSV